MKLIRISKVKNHRVFTDFAWPVEVSDFAQFNLIYGWNGTGKTTLSNLLRQMEIKQPLTEGEVNFQIDGQACSGASLGSIPVPNVRVFNRNFVDANVFSVFGQMTPIFFLGQDSADKQKQIEELKILRTKEQEKLTANAGAQIKATKALDDLCIREGKAVKELLSSSGTNPYNNYDKSSFKRTCSKLSKLDTVPGRLSESEKLTLKQQKDAAPKETIKPLTSLPEGFCSLRIEIERILERTVVSQVIAELQSDSSLADWAKTGLSHHTGGKQTDRCRFCTSQIPEGRIAALEAHFNDEYKRLLTEIDAAEVKIKNLAEELKQIEFPDKAKFHEHLVAEYRAAVGDFKKYVSQATKFFGELASHLLEKRSKPFESLAIGILVEAESLDLIKAQSTDSINAVIQQHNQATQNFQKLVSEARSKLEEGIAADALNQFKHKVKAIEALEAEAVSLKAAVRTHEERIGALEKEILEHRRPADELNTELRSYLGRDELRFSLSGTGYQITRGGVTATNLSEGERSAIAFLYFLKSLHSKDFDLASGVVVIDDPVSSLDANSLFCAFGYMRECTKNAGQLFILTHNFSFFRQVKNWFNHLPGQRKADITQRPGRFYMMESTFTAGKRSATLKQLDPLLHQYESEYHYLFKRVYDEAKKSAKDQTLEDFYSMPNIARRALESFMAFRFPAESGELKQQLDLSGFDPAKKARILRFLHTYSHDGKIAEPEHDLSILSETPAVLTDLLELIQFEDGKHFVEMEKLIGSA